MTVKAILFDLNGTLAYMEETPHGVASEFLLRRGYEVYIQPLEASLRFVSLIDYPRYGYRVWKPS